MLAVRKYYIYLIEDEVADYFYGRENKFYELFAADRYVLGELKKIVQKQIDFITLPLPHLELHRHLSHFADKRIFILKERSIARDRENGRCGNINRRTLIAFKCLGQLRIRIIIF